MRTEDMKHLRTRIAAARLVRDAAARQGHEAPQWVRKLADQSFSTDIDDAAPESITIDAQHKMAPSPLYAGDPSKTRKAAAVEAAGSPLQMRLAGLDEA